MKLKNLMLMALFLMAILTIGAVSAADNATDALAVEDDGDESLEAS